MANSYFAKLHGMHCYIPFFILLISNALLVLARQRLCSTAIRPVPGCLKKGPLCNGHSLDKSVQVSGRITGSR